MANSAGATAHWEIIVLLSPVLCRLVHDVTLKRGLEVAELKVPVLNEPSKIFRSRAKNLQDLESAYGL